MIKIFQTWLFISTNRFWISSILPTRWQLYLIFYLIRSKFYDQIYSRIKLNKYLLFIIPFPFILSRFASGRVLSHINQQIFNSTIWGNLPFNIFRIIHNLGRMRPQWLFTLRISSSDIKYNIFQRFLITQKNKYWSSPQMIFSNKNDSRLVFGLCQH